MNDTNHANSTDPHQWFQYYQQTAATTNQSVIATGGPGFSEGNSTVVTTSFTANNTSSLNNSSAASIGSTSDHHVHLSPQGSAGKPIRRRSRASRRTPTTLLNASTTNFRALVQQFTGCQNSKTTSFGSQKGPVNLSFSKPSMTTTQNDHHHHQTLGTSSRITPLESSYIYDQQLSQVVHQQQQQQMFEKLQINNNSMQSGGLNDYIIDDMSDFHELVDESSSFCSTENNMGGNYYF